MIHKNTHKDSFISGWLEAQPEWQECKNICREHMRRKGEPLSPEYVEKMSALFSDPFDAEDPDLWETIRTSLGIPRHLRPG